MVIQKIISARPSLDVPFFKISQELEDFQKNGHGMNMFIEKNITYSPNGLAEIIEIKFKSKEEMKSIMSTELVIATGKARNIYCESNKIILKRVTEILD